MLSQYHASMLTDTLGELFTPKALQEIITANVWQDAPWKLIGHAHIHFDACQFKSALAYIDSQQAIAKASKYPGRMRAAFGRLTHGAQDFYAHSNYVDLWLEKHGGLKNTVPADINGHDSELFTSPELRSGFFYLWRDVIYYLPGIKEFAKQYLVFANSHEAMHLDDPSRGPKFFYAIEAAKQRTLMEYRKLVQALSPEQVVAFHGHAQPQPLPQLI
jgi:hypothetical protein